MSTKAELFKPMLAERDVRAFRMITGEEVVARVNSIHDDHIVIDQPRVLIAQLQRKSDGTPFMAANILNWLNSNPEGDTKVCYTDIIAVTKPESGITNEYIRFTTGIELLDSFR